MPPSKSKAEDKDSRSETSNSVRERQIAAAAHARSSKAQHSKLATTLTVPKDASAAQTQEPPTGMHWPTAPTSLLNTYRVVHCLPVPACFTSPYNAALLTNPGIGRQSPTMARRKAKRRVSKDVLATAVRKHFNSAAVSESDVVVDMVYKVRMGEKRSKTSGFAGKRDV